MADVDDLGALAGVRVLDLTCGLAGPVAGMLLADLGADVVKVYPPGGGPSVAEPGLHMWDRGKRPAVLDPASPADLQALDRLVAGADVLLIGTSGPAVRYSELRDRGHVPGQPCFWIVMPPYLLGDTPWTGEHESGGLLFSWLGHAWSQSSYDDVPVDCLYPLSLYMQGIWAAAVAVALLTGRQLGRQLAPLAVAGGAHGGQLVSPGGFAAGRDEPHVHRPGGPGGTLPNYRCYRCSDGQWLFFGAFTNAFIERGLNAVQARWLLEDPRVGGDPASLRLPGNLVWITGELEKIFAGRTRSEWLELLEAADVPVAQVAEPGYWLEHEQVRAMGLRLELRNDAGQDVLMPGPLIGLSDTPVNIRAASATSGPSLAALGSLWLPRPAAAGAESQAAPELPLSGLRVLNLGTIIAGPYLATLLGELGAEVIKVERPPHGDEFRTAHGGRGGVGFAAYNRDQRSILLDLTSGPERNVFLQLAASSDVVVDNYRAGVLTRLGIGHDQLSAVNPAVTTVSISAFGESGPLGHRPGFDPIIQAMSGIMRGQGGPDEADAPAFLTVPVNDVVAAGLGALGACTALFARSRLGRGQRVTITLAASSCLLQSEHLVRFPGALPFPAGGRDFAGPGPLDRLYQAADGWVRLHAMRDYGFTELQAAGLAEAGTAGAPADGDDAAAFTASIAAVAARLSAAEVVRRATAAGIPAVPARQVRELVGDEQLIRHRLLAVIEQDESGVARVGPGRWLEMPGLPAVMPGDAPAPGEHSEAILREVSRTSRTATQF